MCGGLNVILHIILGEAQSGTIWFFKGAKYIKNTNVRLAFVSTNSICQGEQVAILWKPIFDMSIEISFAYTSFKWKNNAKNNAQVSVVIIGLSNINSSIKKIYSGTEILSGEHINAYLTFSENIFLDNRSSPLCNELPDIIYGSEPRENNNLMLTPDEKNRLLAEGNKYAHFIKKVVGSDEILNDIERYCIWIDKENLSEALSSKFIENRIAAVKKYRLTSKRKDTVDCANIPYRFTNCTYRPSFSSLIIPIISSENRMYIPMEYVNSDVVTLNSAFSIYDAELYVFAILTSKMHNIWVRAVAGCLENRIRYSSILCYNTFPFPKLSLAQKEKLALLAKDVIFTRENHTELTLGDMYKPNIFPDDLREAHHNLDMAVEKCYREAPFTSDEERLEYLFKLYTKLKK